MSRRFFGRCLFGAGLIFGAVGAPAFANSGEQELKRFIDDTKTVSAHFSQVQTNEKGQKLQSSSGEMILSRPGRFRWAYQQPYEQLMVCDGSKIWLYDPDLSQVTVRPAADTLTGTPAALLAQRSTLTEEFGIEDLGARNGTQGVRLKPRSNDGDFEAIELWLRGGAPERMVFQDRLGNRTEVAFSEIKVNGRIDEAQLRFTPPKGAEIVEAGGQGPQQRTP